MKERLTNQSRGNLERVANQVRGDQVTSDICVILMIIPSAKLPHSARQHWPQQILPPAQHHRLPPQGVHRAAGAATGDPAETRRHHGPDGGQHGQHQEHVGAHLK